MAARRRGGDQVLAATLPEETPIADLVHLAKQRWLIERDYLELKQELGLGHYEGRGWRGFHHHAALCIAAYGFLVAERAALPPSGASIGRLVKAAAVPAVSNPRLPHCVQSGTCRTRSRRCEGVSHTRLLSCCHDVRAAIDQGHRQSPIKLVCDAVRLGATGSARSAPRRANASSRPVIEAPRWAASSVI